ncbi:MAG: cytochrome b5 domain-containing protein [Candidatus Doudnabacteria bacterium]
MNMKKTVLILAILFLAAGCGAKKPTVSNTTQLANTEKSYTMAEIVSANSASKCWVAISGKVYDLTKWVDMHPGGPENILAICGTDATQAFNNQHGGQRRPMQELTMFKIGVLK